MRINLNCPFVEKDAAKRLGARWDAERKTWYIENVEDLTPFMRWVSKSVDPVKVQFLDYIEPKSKKSQKNKIKHCMQPRITGVFKPLCQCDVLPWDDCKHTRKQDALNVATLKT